MDNVLTRRVELAELLPRDTREATGIWGRVLTDRERSYTFILPPELLPHMPNSLKIAASRAAINLETTTPSTLYLDLDNPSNDTLERLQTDARREDINHTQGPVFVFVSNLNNEPAQKDVVLTLAKAVGSGRVRVGLLVPEGFEPNNDSSQLTRVTNNWTMSDLPAVPTR